MTDKLSKSESRRIKALTPLRSFFYPKLGSGMTIKAATKEEADAKVAKFLAKK